MLYHPPEKDMDALVARIGRIISESGVCQLRHEELMAIWRSNGQWPDDKKRMAVQHFARQHGFFVAVDYDLKYAVFR